MVTAVQSRRTVWSLHQSVQIQHISRVFRQMHGFHVVNTMIHDTGGDLCNKMAEKRHSDFGHITFHTYCLQTFLPLITEYLTSRLSSTLSRHAVEFRQACTQEIAEREWELKIRHHGLAIRTAQNRHRSFDHDQTHSFEIFFPDLVEDDSSARNCGVLLVPHESAAILQSITHSRVVSKCITAEAAEARRNRPDALKYVFTNQHLRYSASIANEDASDTITPHIERLASNAQSIVTVGLSSPLSCTSITTIRIHLFDQAPKGATDSSSEHPQATNWETQYKTDHKPLRLFSPPK
ncbi:hypothetical protein BLNAU_7782 [Blattamonas nauphoetae]|uniref:Uncharacterized protein n=1 Tax=Blattamonas nauphoetae TaxID=2049346 RepID=A0ABQ9Y0E2_9EUKA|nr:hypothetical protein BLNAU_7782 [Blattamonas nauphoetae]